MGIHKGSKLLKKKLREERERMKRWRGEETKRRWARMSEEERDEMRRRQSEGMKNYWASKTDEERKALQMKAAETRKRRRLERLHGKGI